MDKLFTGLIPIFFAVAFTGSISEKASAEARIDPWGFPSIDAMAVDFTFTIPDKISTETQVDPWETPGKDAMETEDLSALTGRDNLTNVQSIQELEATVSNGTFNANTIITGAITIEQHALNDFEGAGVFTFNTGNNNAFNSAIGISIYLTE